MRTRSIRSAALVMAAVFVPGSALAQDPVRARPLSPADRPATAVDTIDVLVEVKVERGRDTILTALQRDSTVLLPVRVVLGLLEIHLIEVVTGRRLAARYGRGPVTLLVDTDRLIARRGGTEHPLRVADAVWRDDELFLADAVIAALLAVQVTPQWADLMVLIAATEEMPVVQRLARERRRAALVRQAEDAPPPFVFGTAAPVVDGMAVDWSVTASTIAPALNNGAAVGIGAAVLGGALQLQSTVLNTPLGTTSQTLGEWTKAWRDRRWLSQVSLGDIATAGARPFGVKGVLLTNQPYLRPSAFAVQDLSGRLAPGWEVEVYRGGELLGYQPAGPGGTYAIGVPVSYGPNPLQTVVYGPNGELRRHAQTFFVPFTRIPAGRFEYAVAGGRCRARCDGMANLDARYGVTDRLTVQIGLDRFWRADSLGDLFHPYGLATFALTRPLSFTVEGVVGALARARLDLDPSPDLHVDGGYTLFDTTMTEPLVGSVTYGRQADGVVFWRPGLLRGELYLQAGGAIRTSATRERVTASLATTARVTGVRYTLGARVDDDRATDGSGGTRTTGVDVSADGVMMRGPRVLKGALLRATMSWECADLGAGCRYALARWGASLGRQLLRVLRLDLGLRHEQTLPGVSLDVTLQMVVPWMRATSRNSWERTAGVSGTQIFEGSFLWDRRTGRPGFANGRNLGRAGIAGLVFLDQDGNGRRDGDDIALPGVLLRVGSDAVTTDSTGRFSVWDLVPFVEQPLEVDTFSLENPLWVPTAPVGRVVPAPNSFRYVEIPVQAGGELSGRVELNGRPLAGVALALRDVATGRIRRVDTFTDATFYVMRLAPGRYTLAPAAGLLEQLHARAETIEFEIGGAGTFAAEAVVRIQRP